mmetsp:Transcript_41134/g.96092  ORF Transcript_41134/g.96092 Transcript_41134/m.96092 type:complete len:523 (+) Transcript_41134:188-1756(+)
MKFAPDVECWKPDHISMVVVSALYIPTVLVGFPVYIAYIIKRAEDNGTLHNPAFMSKWDFAYSRYDPGFKWWEAMLTLRRFSIALISISLDTSLLQASLTIIVLVFLLIWHAHTRPFLSDQIDTLEVFTICGSIFYALAGMLFYPSITADAQGYICNDDTQSACSSDLSLKNAISIALVAFIAATLVYSFWVSYLCVVEVNNSSKANKVMKSMLGLGNDPHASTTSFIQGGAESARSLPSSFSAGISGIKAPFIKDRAASGNNDSKSAAATVEKSEPPLGQEEAGGEQVEVFSKDFAAAFEVSSNRLTLDDLVDGKGMLRWAREVEQMPSHKRRRCMEDFEVVTLGLLALERDVTHFSRTQYAEVCRLISSHEGIVDYLTVCPNDERAAVARFMEGYAVYMEERVKMSEKGKTLYPLQSICIPEHTSVIVSYIINSSADDVRRIANVMRDISGLEEGEEIDRALSFEQVRALSFEQVVKKRYKKPNAVVPSEPGGVSAEITAQQQLPQGSTDFGTHKSECVA